MASTRTVEHRVATATTPALEVQRSRRRRRSATAFPREGRVVVQLPAGLAPPEEERLITSLVRRVTREQQADAVGGDDALAERCAQLADRYLDGVRPTHVAWSGRMSRRYGSCTPATGHVRISHEVAAFPAWVRDAILLHELAHLVVADHSAAFHALVDRYPRRVEADAWVAGYEAGKGAATRPGAPPGAESDVDDPTV